MRVLLRLLLSAMLACSGVLVAVQPTPATAATSSAVTVHGAGEFEGLEVTVHQTTGLINQTVRVSWKGGKPTGPDGNFGTNYLQVMQCWGDSPNGPDREQCQYGGLLTQSSPTAGDFARLRQVSYGPIVVDPLETYLPTPGKQAVVPFRPVRGEQTPDYLGYYDSGTTNEVPLVKTRTDGTGELDFEVQTALESHGLGCGTVLQNGRPRSCWLVVVPRGEVEVNGKRPGTDDMPRLLVSSPLSASNFRNRLAVKLSFRPIGRSCPIGAAERATAGHEFVADAMLRWQPALCAGGGTVYGYNTVADSIARLQLTLPEPALAFLSDPLLPTLVPPDRRLVYAPVALSGLAFAFITERQSAGEGAAPPEIWQRDGQLMSRLNLTPRLVAKLLTQSYWRAIPSSVDYLKDNPASLTKDPEFLQLNPDFVDYGVLMSIVDAIAPSGDTDATKMLWNWVNGDREARAFLDGKPDPWGMVVNRNYRELALPVSDFPKADLTCEKPDTLFETCALTLHPLAADLHEGGRAVSRGDSLGKAPTGFANPDGKVELKKVDRQPQGQRGLIAIVDTATAARYGLATARLRTAAGTFVAPTTASLLAAARAMRPTGVPGVVGTDTGARARNAYPLANLTYAATAPAKLTPRAGREYAAFLRYAVGPGQRLGVNVGELPFGYAPLPADLREQARRAAARIERDAGKAIGDGGNGAGGPGGSGGGNGLNTGGSGAPTAPIGNGTGAGGGDGGGDSPGGDAPTPGAKAPAEQDAPQALAARTPALPVGWVRYALASMLVLGGLAAGGSPVLRRLSVRVRG